MGLHGGVGDSAYVARVGQAGRVAAPFTRRARNLVIRPARLNIIIIRIRTITYSAYGDRAISIQSPINLYIYVPMYVCTHSYHI